MTTPPIAQRVAMINPDTIWNETYANTKIAGMQSGQISILSAIHGTAGPILRIEIDQYNGGIELRAKVNLTPDEAEKMAAELLVAAEKKRRYGAIWAAYLSEQNALEAA